MVYRNPISIDIGADIGANSKIAQSRDRHVISYQVVFQREGHDVETLYWAGSMAEAQELAREIAFRGGTDAFRIIEFTGGGAGATPGRGI